MKPLFRLALIFVAALSARAEIAFVTTAGDDKVARVGSSGTVSEFIASGLVNPSGIVFDVDGNAFVANFGTNSSDGTVLKFPAAGGAPTPLASNLNGPTGLALGSDEALYVAVSGANQILKISAAGTPVTFASLAVGSNAQGIAFSPEGDLYVACKGTNAIVKITPTGSVTTFSTEVTAPTGVAFTAREMLAISGGTNGVISQFNPRGKANTYLGGFTDPRSIAVDRLDHLYIVNGGDHSLKKVDGAKQIQNLATGLADPQFVAVRGIRIEVVVAKGNTVTTQDGSPEKNATFAALGQPTLAATGDVAYGATLTAGTNVATNSTKGIWRDAADGTRTRIARASFNAPGTASAVFATLSDPVINAHGKIAFRATTRLGDTVATNTSGIWTDVSGSVDLAIRTGDAPGGVIATSGAARFTAFSSIFLPDAGLPIFQATIAGAGITLANNSGIWQATAGRATQLLLRKGQQFTFGTKTVKVTAFTVLKPAPFVGGQSRSVAPDGGVTVLVGFSDLSKAVLRLRGGNTQVLARKGDSITIDGAYTIAAPLNALFSPAISANGDVAWRGTLRAGANGITAANAACIFQDGLSGSRAIVARAGSSPSDEEETQFATLADPVINAGGKVAFRATLKPGIAGAAAGNLIGLWSNVSGKVKVAARQGDPAPGLPTGVKFTAFTSFVLPDGGGLVTLASVAGAGTDLTNNQGVWAEDLDGKLQKVLRKGDKLAVNGAGRTIASLKIFSPLPFVAGQGRSYAGTGDLTLLVSFTDTSQAVVRVVFP